MTIEEWLGQCEPETRARVERLAELVRAADEHLAAAVKWRRLAFTANDDWHHWLCAVAVTARGVSLMFHEGALLADPARLLRGEGKYLRQVGYDRAVGAPEEVTALMREAIAHQHDMLG